AGRWLPVFHLFRQHPRILVVASLPIAYLVGITTQALFVEAPSPRLRRLCFRITLALGALAILAAAGFVVGRLLVPETVHLDVYWAFMLVFFVIALWLLRPTGPRRALPWAILLLADLWALTWPLVETRPAGELF